MTKYHIAVCYNDGTWQQESYTVETDTMDDLEAIRAAKLAHQYDPPTHKAVAFAVLCFYAAQ